MNETPTEPTRTVRDHVADVVDRDEDDVAPTVVTPRGKEVADVDIDTLRPFNRREEQELNRIIDERMANGEPITPLRDVTAETLARHE